MIDAQDHQTQQIPFEQPKRGRGRPSTGKAMTPAEKQKAYRDRQKAAAGNVTKISPELRSWIERHDEMARKLGEATGRIQELMRQVERLEKELKATDRKKRHRDEPAAPLSEWAIYGKTHKNRKNWTRLTPEGEEFETEKKAVDGITEVQSLGKTAVYTVFKVT